MEEDHARAMARLASAEQHQSFVDESCARACVHVCVRVLGVRACCLLFLHTAN